MSKVTIVFAHHHNSITPLFELCLESLSRQNVNKDVIVMDSREVKTPMPSWVKHVEIDNSTIAPVAYNMGFKLADADSNLFLMCNDDLIFGKDSVFELMEAMKGNDVIMNAFSNCDLDFYYWSQVLVKNEAGQTLRMKRQMAFSEIAGFEEALMNYPVQSKILMPTSFNCFYATIMNRTLWEAIGGLEERYISGPDDRDFCLEAQKLGIRSVINLAPTIWHLSGRTMETKNPETVAKNRAHNNEVFKSKWGVYP